MLANSVRQIELASILANFFHQRFRVGKLVSDLWTIGKHELVTVNQSKHAHKMRDSRTLKFIEEVQICPAVWDVSSTAHKDTRDKQKTMEVLVDKLGFVQTFLFLHPLFFFFSFLLLFHCSTWVPVH